MTDKTTELASFEILERASHVVTLQGDGEATVLTVREFGYVPGPVLDMPARSSAWTSSSTSLRSSEGRVP